MKLALDFLRSIEWCSRSALDLPTCLSCGGHKPTKENPKWSTFGNAEAMSHIGMFVGHYKECDWVDAIEELEELELINKK